ncbi:MAG: DUF4363 family protein [Clostridia bacterium]|nr:DUF4363 family protein [Clostridia bacterium]
MSVKTWITLFIALAIVLSAGLFEVFFLRNEYDKMLQKCDDMIALCQTERATLSQYQQLERDWYKLRETTELMLPHVDTYELSLRFSECATYVKDGDFKNAEAQLNVARDLLQYIPHMMIPNIRHIA